MASKKIILVTGANSGVGYETSYTLADASPNNHVIMGCRNTTKGAKALEEIQARKPAGTLSMLEVDISNDDSINAAAQKMAADFGVLDVLVNNAGIYIEDKRDRRTDLLETFNTNAAGPVVLTDALLPLLKKSKDPRIINVTSELGSMTKRADPNAGGYNLNCDEYRMSKAALNMASVCMNEWYKSWGAKVWSYCPGWVVSDLGGRANRQFKIENGADSPETSAQGILDIVEGKRDGEAGLFVMRWGRRSNW
ncbi:hypothetical protein BDY21DRAFT_387821 [Lineolata rhizophorae]|uniref:Short chain dehydrogenase n=1 Tax=Lineolata rhizophorae TaxID=578093 RepID=A0A6A6NQB1_9PEZI|nr:hypothetical protein BDY21DRAFT_387821 [Lineolata rhizophorae]